jgi:hypothetical protein
VTGHGDRLPIAIAAATIHARPPIVATPVPVAASTLTRVGSDRTIAAVPMAAPIVHRMAPPQGSKRR